MMAGLAQNQANSKKPSQNQAKFGSNQAKPQPILKNERKTTVDSTKEITKYTNEQLAHFTLVSLYNHDIAKYRHGLATMRGRNRPNTVYKPDETQELVGKMWEQYQALLSEWTARYEAGVIIYEDAPMHHPV